MVHPASAAAASPPSTPDIAPSPGLSGPDAARPARWVLAGLVAATAIAALLANGAYHDDDLKHYLFARWSRIDPRYLVNAWGRPGFTLLYAVPAQLGWRACRLVSVALTAVTAWATFAAATRLGLRRAVWVIPLLYIQPLVTHLSLTTLTETPAAMYVALATWALLAGRTRCSAAVMSLTLITRHEAIVLLPVWAWALYRRRAPLSSYICLLWAPLAWNTAAWLAFGLVPWGIFASPGHTLHYGQGTPVTFIVHLVTAAGPFVTIAGILGLPPLWRIRAARPIVAGVVVYWLAQTLLYMNQAYATGGYARFLVPIGPWLAAAALCGVDALLSSDARRRRVAWTAAAAVTAGLWTSIEIERACHGLDPVTLYAWAVRAALAVIIAAFALGVSSRWHRVSAAILVITIVAPLGRAMWPPHLRPRERELADAVAAIRAAGLGDRPLYSCNDWPYYFAGQSYPTTRPPWYEVIASAPTGTLFYWENRYAPGADFQMPLSRLADDPQWRERYRSPPDADGLSFVHVFERVNGATTATAPAPPAPETP